MVGIRRPVSIRLRKVNFVPSASGVLAEMCLEGRSLAAPGLTRSLVSGLLDSQSTDGNAQAILSGHGLASASASVASTALAGIGQASAGAPDSREAPLVSGSPAAVQQNQPEFIAPSSPTLINASVGGSGGVDKKADNKLSLASASASVVTKVDGGLGPSVTLTQTGTATAEIEGPTVQNGSGPNSVGASFSLLNGQTVSGPVGPNGSNKMTTAVKGGRTYGLASSGPNSINTTLLQSFSFEWLGPIGTASVTVTSNVSFSSPDFTFSSLNGSSLFTQTNPASTVTEVPPSPNSPNTTLWNISTPVTLPVYPSVSNFSFSFSGNINSTLTTGGGTTNSEALHVTYTAGLSS